MFLACSRQGYVCNPSLHQNYTVAEIVGVARAHPRRCAVRAIRLRRRGYDANGRTADIFSRTAELPSLRRVYSLGENGGDGVAPFPDAAAPPDIPPPEMNPDSVVYLAFTSGTTGTPKGVMHSSNTLLANARAMVEDWGHDHTTILLSLSPLSHHIATVALAEALAAGMELVVNAPPAGMTPLDWILETGASYVMGVPTHAIDILGEMRRRGGDQARRRQDVLHGRIADSARGRAGVSRSRRHPAERLRDEREQLASVHLAERRPGDDRRDLRASLPRL